jgi:MGT family glycosyltransferase
MRQGRGRSWKILLSFSGVFMRVAFLTPSVPGHAYPMSTLARRLKSRGHDVVSIVNPDAVPFVRAAELPFVLYCEKEYPAGSLREKGDQLSRLQGQEALEFTHRTIAEIVQTMFNHLPGALRETGAQALVLDGVHPELGLVPMHLGMPYVHVSNSLHYDFSGHTPLFAFDWPHETTPEAFARNKEAVRSFLQLLERNRSIARTYAEQVGLDFDCNDPLAGISKFAWLTQTPKEFDFPSSNWPPQFHHTGPFHDGSGRSDPDFPWDRLTGEPLIYASMGTLQNGLESVFNTIAQAVGSRAGMQLVLSIGPVLDPEQIKSLPAKAIVVNRAPQMELLKRSVLCITHAGLNTTLESLTQGVPLVAIPVTNDQPGVAARIAHTKTGAFVPLKELTVSRLSSLIDEVLRNPEYRQNANRLRQVIADTNGLEKALDLLEEALGLHRRWKHRDTGAAIRTNPG